jgi:hypothetical protein
VLWQWPRMELRGVVSCGHRSARRNLGICRRSQHAGERGDLDRRQVMTERAPIVADEDVAALRRNHDWLLSHRCPCAACAVSVPVRSTRPLDPPAGTLSELLHRMKPSRVP